LPPPRPSPLYVRFAHVGGGGRIGVWGLRPQPPEASLASSALWDAAFDRGLVSFADDGRVLPLAGLSELSFAVLAAGRAPVLRDLSPGNRERLRWHRGVFGA
jgi:hypothetical protein